MAEPELRFSIETLVMDGQMPVAIDEVRFAEIAAAVENLATVLGIEEKLDLLMSNFAEYEGEVLNMALQHMLHRQSDWSSFRNDRLTLNRRIVNFLSAARLYLDQLLHEISSLYTSDSPIFRELKVKISAEYDSNLAYRVMEVVRNHVQHQRLPIGKMTYPIDIERVEPATRFRFSVVAYLDVEQLLSNPKAKKAVISEFAALDPQPDLTTLMRAYLESLCRIHEETRKLIDSDIESWDQLIDRTREGVTAEFKDGLLGLAVVARDRRGRVRRQFYLLKEISSQRRQLRAKNRTFKNLGSRYVASERAPA